MSWMDTKALREQAQELIGKAGAILENAKKKENRSMTAEENQQFEKYHADAESRLAEARQIERQAEANKTIEQRIGKEDFSKAEAKKLSEFERYLRTGIRPETRALTKGTSTSGAEFVPEGFYNSYVKFLRDGDVLVEAGAEVITTDEGRDLPIPTMNDTSNTGELLAESSTGADAGADPVTGEVILKAHAFSSKVVRLSLHLIEDSGYDIETALAQVLAERLIDVQNTYYTTGTGSAQPKGVVTAAGLGKTTTGTAAITYPEMLDLIHSVPRQYRHNARLMFNDSTLLALKKLVDDEGNPMWNAGNIGAGVPATFDGVPYVINPKMDDLGASKKPILFGDFSYYKIRRVNGAELLRFDDSAYMKTLQVGFMLYVRADGNCVNSNAIKYLANAASAG